MKNQKQKKIYRLKKDNHPQGQYSNNESFKIEENIGEEGMKFSFK